MRVFIGNYNFHGSAKKIVLVANLRTVYSTLSSPTLKDALEEAESTRTAIGNYTCVDFQKKVRVSCTSENSI